MNALEKAKEILASKYYPEPETCIRELCRAVVDAADLIRGEANENRSDWLAKPFWEWLSKDGGEERPTKLDCKADVTGLFR